MPRSPHPPRPRRRQVSLTVLVAAAAVTGAAIAGMAAAKVLTLSIARNASVVSGATTKHEPIVVNAHGHAVYELSPETIHHPLCTLANGCLSFWPPVTVASAKAKPTAGPGVKGKLGIWHRDGMFQVTLGGHPLYTFVRDTTRDVAHGEGIKGFGGTWHVIAGSPAAAGSKHGTTATTTATTPMTTATQTTTNPCPSGY